eukprot:TRINITY_DN19102_c0_g1_i14.p5 TRINITY_DN19102_c0_g1~~TRINITY_DN19102_c0_g1_i14.p5  ORF type:complete len:103 (-),score=0.75 TRINITY_DN19102_c0_g1_i14:48-356(-)
MLESVRLLLKHSTQIKSGSFFSFVFGIKFLECDDQSFFGDFIVEYQSSSGFSRESRRALQDSVLIFFFDFFFLVGWLVVCVSRFFETLFYGKLTVSGSRLQV